MSLELRLNLKQTQQLVMTPQLQQAIKLLQLGRLELAEEIREQLEENPALEEAAILEPPEALSALELREVEGPDSPGETPAAASSDAADAGDSGDPEKASASEASEHELASDLAGTVSDGPDVGSEGEPGASDHTDEIDWRKYLTESAGSDFYGGSRETEAEEDRPSPESLLTRPSDLEGHLEDQLRHEFDDPVSERIGMEIIGSLDGNGYLADDLSSIAERLRADADLRSVIEANPELADYLEADGTVAIDEAEVERVLRCIQHFDPLGVAARDVRECLLIQVRALMPQCERLITIIEDHLPDLENRRYKQIAKALDVSIEELVDEIQELKDLNPKPGLQYTAEAARYITPDIYVHKIEDEFVVVLNDDGLPKLRISSYYRRLLTGEGADGDEARAYIRDKLKSAAWLIKSIHQRQRTIFKVTESIVRFQREFLEHGVNKLRPLVLKDVADDIGMHESTVSRVTTNKYVHTPQGIFELKYFFNTSIQSSHGGEGFAAETVKEKIRHLIAAEDGRKPLSDQKIVQVLKQKDGIEIARRTVTKYREMLGILSSAKRKQPF